MTYIQRRDGRQLETVDQFDTRREARAMLAEYRMAGPSAVHYLSSRPCRDWATDPTPANWQAARGGERAPLDLSPRITTP